MKMALTGRNFTIDDKIRAYADEKLASLDKYMARTARDGAHVEVVLEEDVSGREDNRFVCDAVLVMPGARLVAREGTVSMYAAIDIVEAKLQTQITKHKDKHQDGPGRNKWISKWLGRSAGEPVVEEPADSADSK